MEDPSKAVLAEKFEKHITVLDERLRKLKKLSMPPETSLPGLLRLPIEIRLQIYYYCIPRKCIIDVANPRFNTQWFSVDRILDFKAVLDDTDSENLLDDTDSEDVQDSEDVLVDMNLDDPQDEMCLNAVQKLHSLGEDFDGTQDETSLEFVQDLEDNILCGTILEYEECNVHLSSDYWNPT
ncbi:hypothetical protein PMIN01_13443 [Paraphaeosphaeria minitans]|uniref:Uncharacterized protein n=1 Tax=Paraphaeosphaeria minitans TaxID=565426 RepID=A0A9P6G681_9PLEO|nr:hypothetical protein PMIN01_13443 [Paraphaeosphaeria minitans]